MVLGKLDLFVEKPEETLRSEQGNLLGLDLKREPIAELQCNRFFWKTIFIFLKSKLKITFAFPQPEFVYVS